MTEYPAHMAEVSTSAAPQRRSHSSPKTVCIGVFDGVHRGHQMMLKVGRAVARDSDTELEVVTFDPHPSYVVKPESAPPMISSVSERTELLLAEGVEGVRVIPFTIELAQQTPEEFAKQHLAGCLHVVVGQNFTFGAGAAGTVETLRDLGGTYGFTVHPVDLATDGDGATLSSSRVRGLVHQGDVAGAMQVLGRAFTLAGTVVYGDQRGRQLGYPTANLRWDMNRLIPGDGVYAGFLRWNSHRYPAAISVGTNPQFEGAEKRIEAYVLDRDDLDLYGQTVEFEFTDFLRSQEIFPDLDAYLDQMKIDVARARPPMSTQS